MKHAKLLYTTRFFLSVDPNDDVTPERGTERFNRLTKSALKHHNSELDMSEDPALNRVSFLYQTDLSIDKVCSESGFIRFSASFALVICSFFCQAYYSVDGTFGSPMFAGSQFDV